MTCFLIMKISHNPVEGGWGCLKKSSSCPTSHFSWDFFSDNSGYPDIWSISKPIFLFYGLMFFKCVFWCRFHTHMSSELICPYPPNLESRDLYMMVCPSVGPSVRRSVALFFRIADFEWNRHINHRISIEFKFWNIICPLTIEKKHLNKN